MTGCRDVILPEDGLNLASLNYGIAGSPPYRKPPVRFVRSGDGEGWSQNKYDGGG